MKNKIELFNFTSIKSFYNYGNKIVVLKLFVLYTVNIVLLNLRSYNPLKLK